MAISRTDTPSDATWARAWTVADLTELNDLMNTYLSPLGPKRGDIIARLDILTYYLVVAANTVKPINLLETDNTWDGDNDFTNGVFERGRSVAMGVWQDTPYDAADYFGQSGLTWTVSAGQAAVNRYMLIGSTLFWNVSVVSGVVGGSASNVLNITFPGGFEAHTYQDFSAAYIEDAGVAASGFVFSPGAGSSEIWIVKFDATAYTAGNVSVDFNIALEIDL